MSAPSEIVDPAVRSDSHEPSTNSNTGTPHRSGPTQESAAYRVRVVPSSWWPQGRSFEHDDLVYSSDVRLEEADALLALYDPTEELLKFHGPKLWYTYEPSWHSHYRRHPVGKRLVKTLLPSEWVHFASPDPANRVPHIAWGHDLARARAGQPRRRAAVACVSNFGGPFWFLKPHIQNRNRLILHPLVELYGRRREWDKFRRLPFLWRMGVPANFCGEIAGSHMDGSIRDFLAGYQVCVCLENSCEPYYFTEKFVNAARAGCIPVYHAHATVADRFLKGAKWVDPSDFAFDPARTLRHALAQGPSHFQRANDAWLDSGILNETSFLGFWNRLHSLLKQKLTSVTPKLMSAETCRGIYA